MIRAVPCDFLKIPENPLPQAVDDVRIPEGRHPEFTDEVDLAADEDGALMGLKTRLADQIAGQPVADQALRGGGAFSPQEHEPPDNVGFLQKVSVVFVKSADPGERLPAEGHIAATRGEKSAFTPELFDPRVRGGLVIEPPCTAESVSHDVTVQEEAALAIEYESGGNRGFRIIFKWNEQRVQPACFGRRIIIEERHEKTGRRLKAEISGQPEIPLRATYQTVGHAGCSE